MSRQPSLIMICGQNRSGTTLAQRLLDGHPQLAVAPVEDGVIRAMYSNDVSLMQLWHASYESLWQFLYERTLLTRTRKLDWKDYMSVMGIHDLNWDHLRSRLQIELKVYPPADDGQLLRTICATWFPELRSAIQIERKPLVLKTPKAELAFEWLFECDSQARMIYCFRDPFQTFVSSQMLRMRRGEISSNDTARHIRLAQRFCDSVIDSAAAVTEAQQCYPDQVYMMCYERLVQEPETAMREVKDFLGISWTERCLRPTVCGIAWLGNTSTGVPQSGIQANRAQRRYGVIPPEAEALLGMRLASVLHDWGYDPVRTNLTLGQRLRLWYQEVLNTLALSMQSPNLKRLWFKK
jgi:hypothetical protein